MQHWQWCYEQKYTRQTRLWWHDSIECSGSKCTVFSAFHGHIKEKRWLLLKFLFKWSLHAFSGIPVLWYELFVAISIQWQGFKSVVTSPVPFTYNLSALSDKVAIPFSTDHSKDTVMRDPVICTQDKLSSIVRSCKVPHNSFKSCNYNTQSRNYLKTHLSLFII